MRLERLTIALVGTLAGLYLIAHVAAAFLGWRAAVGLLLVCCWVLLTRAWYGAQTHGGSK